MSSGCLVCVGVGIQLGAHISPAAKSHIERADVVFIASSDPLYEKWMQDLHANVISLQKYYAEGKSRKTTYQEMVSSILDEVRRGQKVVAAFYGHPGVFTNPSHTAIQQALKEGYDASMLPGISAEDCLYADLRIDPGKVGCQHYEASQFMFYKRLIDPSAYLVLWQVSIAGDKSHSRFDSSQEHVQLLVGLLQKTYPENHRVIVYEAATTALGTARIDEIVLSELSNTVLSQKSTLVIPPSEALTPNLDLQQKLSKLNHLKLIDNT